MPGVRNYINDKQNNIRTNSHVFIISLAITDINDYVAVMVSLCR